MKKKLPSKLRKFVEELVAIGDFENEDDVIIAGLRALQDLQYREEPQLQAAKPRVNGRRNNRVKPDQLEQTQGELTLKLKVDNKARSELSTIVDICDGDMSLEEFLQGRLKEDITIALENIAPDYPHLSSRALSTLYRFFRIIDLEDGWLKRGVARRVVLDAPEELQRFLCMHARLSYLWNRSIYEAGLPLDSPSVLVWDVLRALAARDYEAARAYLNLGITQLKKGQKDVVIISNTVYAILSNDRKCLAAVASDLANEKSSNQWFGGIFTALNAIIERDPDGFSDGLKAVLRSRGIWKHPYEKVISLEAHGIVELAKCVSPALISKFDVTQELPWDREFYETTLRNESALKTVNLKILPAEMRTAIAKLQVPKWLIPRKPAE